MCGGQGNDNSSFCAGIGIHTTCNIWAIPCQITEKKMKHKIFFFLLSNSHKPVVRPSVCPSVRQIHLWARRALQASAGVRKGGLNFLVYLYKQKNMVKFHIFDPDLFSYLEESLNVGLI